MRGSEWWFLGGHKWGPAIRGFAAAQAAGCPFNFAVWVLVVLVGSPAGSEVVGVCGGSGLMDSRVRFWSSWVGLGPCYVRDVLGISGLAHQCSLDLVSSGVFFFF